VLAVEGLTVAYGGLTALAEVSLSVRAGQFVRPPD
jgi:ABC-type branched-subunit amino acid transport system ATPase component